MARTILELTIRCEPSTGKVEVTGPLDQIFMCQGMLAEAQRVVTRRANDLDAKRQGNGHRPGLWVPPPGSHIEFKGGPGR